MRCALRAAVALALLSLAPATGAQIITWDGGGANNNWSSTANWNPDQAVPSGALMTFAGTTRLTPNNDLSGVSLQSLNFAAGAGSFTLGGNAITMFSSSPGLPFIQNSSSNAQLINNAITLGADTQVFASAGALTLNGAIANGGRLLTVQGADTTTISGAISGNGGLTKTQTGTLVLSGANSYSGATTITGGVVRLAADNTLPNASAVTVSGISTLDIGAFSDTVGAVTLNSGTITGTTGVLTGTSYTVSQGTIGASLGGIGGLTKNGFGTLNLNSANTYTGATTINDGTVVLGASERISNSSALVVNSGALLLFNGFSETVASLSGSGSVSVGSGALTISGAASTTFTGTLSGTGSFTKAGSGVLTLAGADNTFFGGTVTIDGGTVRITSPDRFPLFNSLVVNSAGTFDLAGSVWNVARLSGSGSVTLGPGTLAFNPANGISSTFAGVISGSGRVQKIDQGSVTLSGANTYTGGTEIDAGTLRLGANNVLADTGNVVVAGGTLDMAGFSDTVGQVQLIDGNIAGTGGVLTASSFELQKGTVSARLGGSGSVAKTGAETVTLTGANVYSGSTVVGQGRLLVSASNVIPDSSALTVQSGAIFELSSTVRETVAALSGDGEIRIGGNGGVLTVGTLSASSVFTGRITGPGGLTKTGAGSLMLTGLNDYGGATTLFAGTLQLPNGLPGSGAAIDVGFGTELQASGVVNRAVTGFGLVSATGTLLLGSVSGFTPFDFNGTLNAGSNLVQMAGAGAAKFGGTVNLAAGGRLTSLDQAAGIQLKAGGNLTATGAARVDGAFINSGAVHGPTGASEMLTFTDNVSGTGSFTGNILFTEHYAPGASPGSVSFENFAATATATVDIDLAGLTQGSEYDFINVASLAQLDGTLSVHLLNGFMPTAGNVFDVMHWGSRTGEFASFAGLDLGGGLFLQPVYGASGLTLIAAAVPETETWLMLFAGTGLLGFVARRRRQHAR
jgi:autotransporter-associated beta strand protein